MTKVFIFCVGFALKITGMIVVQSMAQEETGRNYLLNIDATFVSRAVTGPLSAKSRKHAVNVEITSPTLESL